MLKQLQTFYNNHRILIWLLIRYLGIMVLANLVYHAIFFTIYMRGEISWERFSMLWAELLPYTQILFIGVILVSNSLDLRITRLTIGLHKVANGDFEQEIPTKKSGPFQTVYQDFNRMTQELSQVQNLRDDFTNQFSHEFKTPITSIQGFAKLLKNPNLTEEQRTLYLDTIEKEASRLADLSTNVMTLTALEGQEIVANPETYDVTEQVRQAAIVALPLADKKDISLDLDLEEATITGNPAIFSHVWTNLLGNAIKFTDESGHIWIRLWTEADSISVSFTNDGPLIPEDKLAFLFDKFYQESKTGNKEGLGLGLAITKRALELSGGTIQVESSEETLTRFTVTLPQSH